MNEEKIAKGNPPKLPKNELDIQGLYQRYKFYKSTNNYELHCQEFAYSLIYGNLKTASLPKIFQYLHINQLPQILFLIQADDCRNAYESSPDFSFYTNKGNIILEARKVLKDNNIDGVVASFLGVNKIAVFPIFSEDELKLPEFRNLLIDLAEKIINSVNQNLKQNISISISNLCANHTRFPTAYQECLEALYFNFFQGPNTYSFYDETQKKQYKFFRVDLETYACKIIHSIDFLDQNGYKTAVEGIINNLSKKDIHPTVFKLYMIKLINHIDGYYNESNLKTNSLELVTMEVIKDILSLDFVDDVKNRILCFCNEIYLIIRESSQSMEEKFRLSVDDTLERFYFQSDLNMTKVASFCNYSPPHFSKIFKRVYKENFNLYLAHYRIEKAKQLLTSTTLTIDDIALKTGFNYTSYFCTTFKSIVGKTPLSFRVSHKTG